MRKNFFKKLSFVLAVAMVVTLITPAAGVFAASGLKLNATSKTLHLSGQPGSNKFNFNINGTKKSGWKYSWTSSDEDVAEVNAKNGVTVATGIGKADITVVIKDAKGKKVDTLTAKVTVKDNIKTVKISNVPDKALAVDQEYDFNRSFVTLSGSTKKTTAITRWTVEGENATINEENGLFKATAAGEYTVVARSFQSKAKYEDWKTSKADNLVLAEDSAKITVKASLKDVKQYDASKAVAEFDSNMKDAGLTADTAKLYKIVNGKEVETGVEKIKKVEFDETGKKVTLTIYGEFEDKTEYKFAFGEYTDTFTAADRDLKNVASIEFKGNLTASINGRPAVLDDYVIGKNADGVIIFYGDDDTTNSLVGQFNGCLSYKLGDNVDVNKVYLDSDRVYVYEKGYVAPVTATYEYYYYDSDANEVKKVSAIANSSVTGVDVDYVLNTSSLQFAVATSMPDTTKNEKWAAPYSIPNGEGGYKIFARYKNLVDTDNDDYRYDDGSKFRYESSNTDVLLTYDNNIQPVGEGIVTVIVHDRDNNDKVVGSLVITVKAARNLASAVAVPSYVILNTNSTYGNDGSFAATYIVCKDTMGDNIRATVENVAKLSGPQNGEILFTPFTNYCTETGDNYNAIEVLADATTTATEPGVYRYKFTVSYTDAYGKKQSRDVYITFDVKDGNYTTIDRNTTYKVQLYDGTQVVTSTDLKNVTGTKDIYVKVGIFNKFGVKVGELDNSEYQVTISPKTDRLTDNKFSVVAPENPDERSVLASSGSVLSPASLGSYVISVKATKELSTNDGSGNKIILKANGSFLGSVTYTLKDTTATSPNLEKRVVKAGSVFDIVKDAFTIKVNGKDNEQLYKVTYYIGTGKKDAYNNSDTVAAGNSVRIYQIQVYDYDATNNVAKLYTFTPNVTLEVR